MSLEDLKQQKIRELYLKTLKASTAQAKIDLNLIITTTSPTNAQMIWAIKREAEILKGIISYLETIS